MKVKLLFVVVWLIVSASTASAQTTAFTYQGRLTDGGTAANGNYDLQFALWNTLSGGVQVGATQTINTVAVSNGVFTVTLDFGASAFPSANRFLEINARPSGSGSFTLLTPRQPITSTPYAVRSLNSATADSVPASGLPAGSGNYIQNSASPQSSSNFNISGNGSAGGSLSGNVVNASTQYNLNGSRILSNPGTGNLFAGAGAGLANTGIQNTFVGFEAGKTNTTAGGNSFFGFLTGTANTTGNNNSFFGNFAAIANSTGFSNSFFGSGVGATNTTGQDNSFFGHATGFSNTTGSENSFFGRATGFSNTTGIENSFFGRRAGAENKTGEFNSYFGAQAGESATGSLNTFVGYSTDFDNSDSASGSRNTLLGANARLLTGLLFSPINATAIGANAQVDTSNSLVLGSINGINGATADTSVGIGTTTPTARLSVIARGDGARVLHLGTERAWVFKQFGTGAATALELTGDDPNNNNKNFAINTAGNVGIGTQGPLDKLHVIGDIRVGVFGTNGCLKNNNGGTIVGTCSSDVRFKRDLVPFAQVLNKVTRLQPKYYFWRAEEFPQNNFGAAREAGLVAQEVEQVLPELVSEDEQGFKLVDYSNLPLMLLQAIKEQQAQIQKQAALIERQQSLANRQQQQLDTLKKLACRSHRRARVCRK